VHYFFKYKGVNFEKRLYIEGLVVVVGDLVLLVKLFWYKNTVVFVADVFPAHVLIL